MKDIDLMAFLILNAMFLILKERRKRVRHKLWKNRRFWVRPINQLRRDKGEFNNLFQELKNDQQMFHKYTRMTVDNFKNLLSIVGPRLERKSARAIQPEQRLAVTLRYLSTGDQIASIAMAYRLGISTTHAIVRETCFHVWAALKDVNLKVPSEQEWRDIRQGFLDEWNFPNCIGAIDGKHIEIKAPPNSGSQYFCYKKMFSVVLMAVCNHRYEIKLYDTGSYGSNSDSQILSHSVIQEALENQELNIPAERIQLPGSDQSTHCVFIGDNIFGQHKHMMTPYSGRFLDEEKSIFNYRLSRARRIIENTFGILVQRWRIYHRPIPAHPKNVDVIVLCTLALHNYLQNTQLQNVMTDRSLIEKANFTQEHNYTSELNSIESNSAKYPLQQRDTMAAYFLTSAGEVPWQYEYIRRGRNTENL